MLLVAGVGIFPMMRGRRLCAIFFVLLFIFTIQNYSISNTLTDMDESIKVVNTRNIAQEELRLRYYLQKFYAKASGAYGQNITLYLLVEGSDNIDDVIMICTPEGKSSYNVSMIETSTPNLYTSQLELSVPENTTLSPYMEKTVKCSVQYFVNTTSGMSILSEVCPYQVKVSMLEYDGTPIHFYDTPDLWYLENTIGHEIIWDISTGSPDYYKVYEDEFLIEAWSWSGPVTIYVDNLPLGDYEFEIRATAGWVCGSDTVTVHVVTELPQGVSTDSVGPITNHLFGPFTIPQVGAIAAGITIALFAVFALLYRRRKTH